MDRKKIIFTLLSMITLLFCNCSLITDPNHYNVPEDGGEDINDISTDAQDAASDTINDTNQELDITEDTQLNDTNQNDIVVEPCQIGGSVLNPGEYIDLDSQIESGCFICPENGGIVVEDITELVNSEQYRAYLGCFDQNNCVALGENDPLNRCSNICGCNFEKKFCSYNNCTLTIDTYDELVNGVEGYKVTPVQNSIVLSPDFYISKIGLNNSAGVVRPIQQLDINADGLLDLIMSQTKFDDSLEVNNNLLYYLAPFNDDASIKWITSNGAPLEAKTADLNFDGIADFIVANHIIENTKSGNQYQINSVVIFSNANSSEISYKVNSPVLLPTLGAAGVAVADLNQDGVLDIVFANYRNNDEATEIPSFIYWGRYDTDNKIVYEPDCFPSDNNICNTGICLGTKCTELPTMGAVDVEIGDLNNDGNLDIVFANFFDKTSEDVVNYAEASIVYWGPDFNNESGNKFEVDGATDVELADLNGDDYLDMVFSSYCLQSGLVEIGIPSLPPINTCSNMPQMVNVYINNKNKTFTFLNNDLSIKELSATSLNIYDEAGDGCPDIYAGAIEVDITRANPYSSYIYKLNNLPTGNTNPRCDVEGEMTEIYSSNDEGDNYTAQDIMIGNYFPSDSSDYPELVTALYNEGKLMGSDFFQKYITLSSGYPFIDFPGTESIFKTARIGGERIGNIYNRSSLTVGYISPVFQTGFANTIWQNLRIKTSIPQTDLVTSPGLCISVSIDGTNWYPPRDYRTTDQNILKRFCLQGGAENEFVIANLPKGDGTQLGILRGPNFVFSLFWVNGDGSYGVTEVDEAEITYGY